MSELEPTDAERNVRRIGEQILDLIVDVAGLMRAMADAMREAEIDPLEPGAFEQLEAIIREDAQQREIDPRYLRTLYAGAVGLYLEKKRKEEVWSEDLGDL